MTELKIVAFMSMVFIPFLVLLRIFYLKFGYIEFSTGKKKITLKDFFGFYKN